MKRYLQASSVRYLIATGISANFTLLLPVLLIEIASVEPRFAAAIALVTAFAANFVILKYFVYRDNGGWQAQCIRYLVSAALFRIAEYLGFLILHEVLNVYYVIALGIVISTSFIVKFFVYRLLVFTTASNNKPGLG